MIHWFKRHPEYLISGSTALARDRNYEEYFQYRDNLFVSHGQIVLRLERSYKFPILIVYSDATPYVLPSIYPLKRRLADEEVVSIAKGSFTEVFPKIQNDLEIYYHLRHQNESGNLCILEWDNIDEGAQFYSITAVLQRVRDWFKGTITGDFPLDSAEVDLHAHFWKRAPDISFLYPEKFLDADLIEGEAFALLFSKILKGKFHLHDQKTFFGCAILGRKKNGLYETIDTEMPNFFVEEGIENAIDLVAKKNVLKRLLGQGNLIRCTWFQITKEPTPFKTIDELIRLIGEGEFDAGINRMKSFFQEEQVEKPEVLFIAIRFPNRKNIQEFQLLRIWKKTEISGMLFNASQEEAVLHFLNSYEIIEAVYCERFTDEVFHQRNAGRADRNVLERMTVNLVGVGALGSEIADSMAKAGLGTLVLVDNQVVKGPNPVRHLAGLEHFGIAKAFAVARILADHNPFVKVWPYVNDITRVDLNDFFDDSVIITSIAEDNTEGFLNERAVIANKTVYYVRALRGGKVARIFRVIPGKDACFHCLKLYRQDGKEFINVPEDKALPTIKNECNNPVRPASAADLKLISALFSRIFLDELQSSFGEKNHWVWSSEKINELEAFQLKEQFLAPHPKCIYCNHEKKLKVCLPPARLKEMQEMIGENNKVETGGVLAGYLDSSNHIVITHVSGAGPKAVKLPTKFQKDTEYCRTFLDEIFISSAKKSVYVGEWHSHPDERNKPSGTDIKSLTDIAYQKEYLTDAPLMIIFSNAGEPSCTVHPAGKSFYFAELAIRDN